MSNINMLVNSNNYSGLNDTRGNIYDWKDEYALYEKYKNLTMFSNDYRENHIPLDDESSSFILNCSEGRRYKIEYPHFSR